MGCNCGKKRSYMQVKFQYTGVSALTVTGNATGKRYRFNSPGDMQSIDIRDAAGMELVPVLKKING